MITALDVPALRAKQATDIHIGSDYDILQRLGPIHLADRQMLHVMTITGDQRLIDCHVAAIGSDQNCEISPKEIFRYALYDCASLIAIVQNHPSGDPTPTESEKQAAEDLVSAGLTIDIPVIDHIIVATGGWYSFEAEAFTPDRHNRTSEDIPF